MDNDSKVHLMKRVGTVFIMRCFFICLLLLLLFFSFFFFGGEGGEDGCFCNFGQKVCRLFHVLAQFLCTTSETEVDYYHQKVNVRASERLKKDLRKLGNFRKIREMLESDDPYPACHPRCKF